jgi:hypothetical protein
MDSLIPIPIEKAKAKDIPPSPSQIAAQVSSSTAKAKSPFKNNTTGSKKLDSMITQELIHLKVASLPIDSQKIIKSISNQVKAEKFKGNDVKMKPTIALEEFIIKEIESLSIGDGSDSVGLGVEGAGLSDWAGLGLEGQGEPSVFGEVTVSGKDGR